MVQYVITPWRNHEELLRVRDQFYPQHRETLARANGVAAAATLSSTASSSTSQTRHAVARVSVWMQRGNCPHLIEATAMLTAAVLNDRFLSDGGDGDHDGAGDGLRYAIRSAYSTAFCRFVTGILDSHQTKLRKQNMYQLAKSIGLPATYVELRHQATHEDLPSLPRLRGATKLALSWIWEKYWVLLSGTGGEIRVKEEKKKEKKREYAQNDYENIDHINSSRRKEVQVQDERQDESSPIATPATAEAEAVMSESDGFDDIRAEMARMKAMLEDINDDDDKMDLEGRQEESHGKDNKTERDDEEEEIEDEDSASKSDEDNASPSSQAQNSTGWSQWTGPWIPRPIGVVL